MMAGRLTQPGGLGPCDSPLLAALPHFTKELAAARARPHGVDLRLRPARRWRWGAPRGRKRASLTPVSRQPLSSLISCSSSPEVITNWEPFTLCIGILWEVHWCGCLVASVS